MPIRDDVIAYLADHQCTGNMSRKRLLIRVQTATVEALNPTGIYLDLFDPNFYTLDDTSDYIYLRTFPDYDQENDRTGEGGLRNTFSSPAVKAVSTVRRGFKATITDRRKIILDVVRRVVEISDSSSFQVYSPIKVIDFCLPETSPSVLGTEPATIRLGEIKLDDLPGMNGKGFLKDDWSFTFKESILRLN